MTMPTAWETVQLRASQKLRSTLSLGAEALCPVWVPAGPHASSTNNECTAWLTCGREAE